MPSVAFGAAALIVLRSFISAPRLSVAPPRCTQQRASGARSSPRASSLSQSPYDPPPSKRLRALSRVPFEILGRAELHAGPPTRLHLLQELRIRSAVA